MDLARIIEIAAASPVLRHSWHNGQAPHGYVKGMACAFALVSAKLEVKEAAAVAMAFGNTGNTLTDALAHYAPQFRAAGMSNDDAGPDTLRHLFVLMTGLGMRESSGRFCEGRDRSVPDARQTSSSAEAGLFQMSWDIRGGSPLIADLFEAYANDDPENLGLIFHEGVSCSQANLANFGRGDGAEFQRRCKASPMFSVLVCGVGLRSIRRHWGPINRHEAEVLPMVDEMFKKVQEAA